MKTGLVLGAVAGIIGLFVDQTNHAQGAAIGAMVKENFVCKPLEGVVVTVPNERGQIPMAFPRDSTRK